MKDTKKASAEIDRKIAEDAALVAFAGGGGALLLLVLVLLRWFGVIG